MDLLDLAEPDLEEDIEIGIEWPIIVTHRPIVPREHTVTPAKAGAQPLGFDHPDEDFIPLETYEQDEPVPSEVEGPDPALNDYIALAARLYASGAAQAFLERRLHLQRTHGDKARTDLGRGPAAIATDLAERAAAIRDGLPLRAPLTAAAIEAAQARLATAGALALALFDALAAVVPAAEPEEDR